MPEKYEPLSHCKIICLSRNREIVIVNLSKGGNIIVA